MSNTVLIAGATGYIGSRLAPRLISRGDAVRALVRAPSASRLPPGVVPIVGDALDASDYRRALAGVDTVVHLIGTSHPGPSKAKAFVAVDLASVRALADAVVGSSVRHVVYVSVAQPAPTMQPYIAVRMRGEALLAATGVAATFVRPWYVLGPSHRWALVLVPLYAVARTLPSTRETAIRLGLCTIADVLATLVDAVQSPPPASPRIVDVPEIRRIGSQAARRFPGTSQHAAHRA